MTATLASPDWLVRSGEASSPQPEALGFSTALVVEATAERVADLLPWSPVDPRFARGQYAMRREAAHLLHITGGTLALQRTQPVYEPGEWGVTRMRQGLLWEDEELEPEDMPEAAPSRVIAEWSRRSRARMVRALAEIDFDGWAGGPFAMVTLTLPGDWLAVAPTGRHMKRALERFRWRYRWYTQQRWQAAWKLEFQQRGAPHFHLLMKPPALVSALGYEAGLGYDDVPFERWLSKAWADSVGATGEEYKRHVRAGTNVDFGYRTTDPKRIAVYFLKHSAKTQDSKEYQHFVPEAWRLPGNGPGRFWGVAGLERTRASVELEAAVFYQLRRELRKLHRSHRAKTALDRRRYFLSQMVGETWRRSTLEDLAFFGLRKDRLLRSAKGGGFVVLNDAPAVAHRMAQWLAAGAAVAVSPDVGEPQGSP